LKVEGRVSFKSVSKRWKDGRQGFGVRSPRRVLGRLDGVYVSKLSHVGVRSGNTDVWAEGVWNELTWSRIRSQMK
jgi:hypothetical protein